MNDTVVMTEVTFVYRLAGKGWADASVQVGGDEIELRASWDEDALGDLVRGVLAIAGGASRTHIAWYEEPAENRWILTRDEENLDVVIRWFPDFDAGRPDSWGKPVFSGRCSIHALCAGIAAGAMHVLETYGEDGYRQLWPTHEFPLQELAELNSLINQ